MLLCHTDRQTDDKVTYVDACIVHCIVSSVSFITINNIITIIFFGGVLCLASMLVCLSV